MTTMNRKHGTSSLVDTTSEQIISYIRENNLQPGDKLPTEHSFVEKLNVSRSTLREAVKLLVSRNILEARQGAGTFLSAKRGIPTDPLGLTFMKDDYALSLELLDVRLIFEPEIAALASMHATPAQLTAIEKACTEAEERIRQGLSYDDEDIQLHREIAAASGNRVIQNLVPIIHSSIHQSINASTATADALREQALTDHRRIVDCIKEHDAPGARYAMIMHLALNRDCIIDRRVRSTKSIRQI